MNQDLITLPACLRNYNTDLLQDQPVITTHHDTQELFHLATIQQQKKSKNGLSATTFLFQPITLPSLCCLPSGLEAFAYILSTKAVLTNYNMYSLIGYDAPWTTHCVRNSIISWLWPPGISLHRKVCDGVLCQRHTFPIAVCVRLTRFSSVFQGST